MKQKKVLSPKEALKKTKVINKKKHIIRYDGDLPIEEVTLRQFNQKKYFSDLTKDYYKMNTLSPKQVKVKLGRDRIIFKTPSFTTSKKTYTQTIVFPINLSQIKDKKQLKSQNVLLDCTCEAFHKQGMMYKLNQIDAAVKKEKREDKIWGPRHNNKNFLCKHLKYIIEYFDDIMKNI